MPHVPIILWENQNVLSIESLLGEMRQKQFVLISLRELFGFLRGIRSVSDKACVVLLRVPSETYLERVLSYLSVACMQIVLAVEEPLSAKMCEQLLSMPYLTVIPIYTPQKEIRSEAVFCPVVDADLLRDLRKHGVRMAIAKESVVQSEIPSGIDVLYATEPKAELTDVRVTPSAINLLPLDETPLFSAMHLAIPLSILGSRQNVLHETLACDLWQAEYQPEEDRYTVTSRFGALQTKECEMPKNICDAFCSYLANGYYIEIQANMPIADLNCGDRILLYGYDDGVKAFAAKTAGQHGLFERIDVLAQTVALICASGSAKIRLHLPIADNAAYETENFVRELQSQDVPDRSAFFGREAAVRYANRFYKRFSEGDKALSADSLRMFLEERMRYGFAFWYLAKREDFYLEPFEAYLHMLAKACKPAIDDLRGKAFLQSDMPLYLTSELMRKLLHTEESCVTAFLDEWERSAYRKAYLGMLD